MALDNEDFKDFIKETNSKLDLLISLAQQMAVLQNTQNHHADELIALNQRVVALETDNKVAITRAHERVDALQNDSRTTFHKLKQELIDTEHRLSTTRDAKFDRVEVEFKRVGDEFIKLRTEMSHCGSVCGKSQQDIKDKVAEVDKTYDRKLHYIKGALGVAALLGMLIPTIASKYYGDVVRSIEHIQVVIEKNSERLNNVERKLDREHK